jgi:hypothetical protein
MPNGIYPVPRFRFDASGARRAPLLLKLRVLLTRDQLDHELAEGADPVTSSKHELRARQLVDSRTRLADQVDRALESAHVAGPPFTAEAPVRRAAVRDCEADMRALVRRLRDGLPSDVQGVALVARLLSDGSGPLYAEGAYSLRYTVRAARLALDPVRAPGQDLAAAA